MPLQGTAFRSGLVKVGDLIHQVDNVDIHNIQVRVPVTCTELHTRVTFMQVDTRLLTSKDRV